MSTEIAGWPAARKFFTLALMSSNWALRSGWLAPFASFAVSLQAEAQAASQPLDKLLTDSKTSLFQGLREMALASAHPH